MHEFHHVRQIAQVGASLEVHPSTGLLAVIVEDFVKGLAAALTTEIHDGGEVSVLSWQLYGPRWLIERG